MNPANPRHTRRRECGIQSGCTATSQNTGGRSARNCDAQRSQVFSKTKRSGTGDLDPFITMIYKTEFRAMGSQMLAALDTPPAWTPHRLDSVPQWFEAWEAALSRFRPESELSLLNQHTGEAYNVSSTLWEGF